MSFMLNGIYLDSLHRFLHIINPYALNSLRILNIHLDICKPHMDYRLRRWAPQMRQEKEQKWEVIWQKLAATTKLRELHIKLVDSGYGLLEDTLLEPLSALRVENFTVQPPWPRG
jgi:hypothetical protein